jgi:protein TonB
MSPSRIALLIVAAALASPSAGSPQAIPQQRARASETLPSLFSSDDYPAAALRAEQEGRVGFRLDIDRRGRVTACSITASSGSPALDSTTCRLLVVRARFEPARNRKGKAVADSFSGRIVWALPAEETPPPP